MRIKRLEKKVENLEKLLDLQSREIASALAAHKVTECIAKEVSYEIEKQEAQGGFTGMKIHCNIKIE